MRGQSQRRISSILRIPELQFFLIFSIPFAGFFLVNYNALPLQYRLVAVVVCVATFVIVLMQTIYSIHAHYVQNQEENAFLNMTAHQMRTPVTAIQWTLQELSKKDLPEAQRVELIKMGGIAGEKLGSIIDSFAQTARINDRQLGVRYEHLDLVAFIEEVVRDTEPVAKQYGVSVYFEKPPQGIEFSFDPVKLEIALSNLVSNSIKYNHSGGMVTIHARALLTEKEVEITIEDTGIGMETSELPHLFSKYFRTEGARQRGIPGTGLGLYLVKTIIEQHGGRIFVESVPTKGSTFRIVLPTR